MGMNLEKNLSKKNEIKENIEKKKGELAELEKNKSELLDTMTDILGSDIEDNSKRKVQEVINESLDDNAKRGIELSGEMNKDLETIEEMKQETEVSIESTLNEQSKLAGKKALLDKFGLGAKLGEGLKELSDSQKNLDQLKSELLNTEKDLSETARKLGML